MSTPTPTSTTADNKSRTGRKGEEKTAVFSEVRQPHSSLPSLYLIPDQFHSSLFVFGLGVGKGIDGSARSDLECHMCIAWTNEISCHGAPQ
mmetsp:Transcript_6837/g.10717  ORF Transcript_6837/g.10717 Transcript_6837/m.10717 type:complete len:91 (-) Transcript_6837:991-1263(-)